MYICQCFYTDKNGYTKNSVYQKKKFRPTDPLFFAYVTGTTEFFFLAWRYTNFNLFGARNESPRV